MDNTRAGLGLGRGGSARARPASSARSKLWNWHAVTSPPNPSGGPAQPSPSSELKPGLGDLSLVLILEGQEANSGRWPAQPPSRGRGKQGQGPWRSKQRRQEAALRMYQEEPGFSPTALASSPAPPARALWKGSPHPISPEQALQGPSQEPSAHPTGSFQRLLWGEEGRCAHGGKLSHAKGPRTKKQNEALDTGARWPRAA